MKPVEPTTTLPPVVDSIHLVVLQGKKRRLVDTGLSPRARRALMHRGPFQEALTWLDIHGEAPEQVEHWRGFIEAAGTFDATQPEAGTPPPRRRRRRRRRGFRSSPN